MSTLTKTVHVSELPPQFRQGREDGFVTLTIEDADTPSDAEKLAFLRSEIAEGDQNISDGHFSPAEAVLRARVFCQQAAAAGDPRASLLVEVEVDSLQQLGSVDG